jgi:hypothetical protein
VGGLVCKTLGESCATAADCCSQNCYAAPGASTGSCVAASTCHANGDLCAADADCCGHTCTRDPATGVARCVDPSGGCIQDGNPCALTGGRCCTGLCRDLGSGAAVCVSATGCRVTGDWCTDTADCCGGSTTAAVTCDPQRGMRCDNGQACNPPGATCGAPVLPGGGHIPASQDCCDGKKDVCKLDSSGIPRCFGGGSTTCPTGYDPVNPQCCIPAGQACEFRDQCCDYLPCVRATPEATQKTCAAISTCKPVGATCSGSGDATCCNGTSCLPSGSGYACQEPAGPVCRANGAACTTSADCCSAICDGTTHVCVEPLACQPLAGPCQSSQDCCTGLTCTIPAGALDGTCTQSNTCPGVGQACSPGTACCPGLSCKQTGTYVTCDGTTPCSCVVPG